METIRRIVYLTFRPAAEWDRIAREPASVDALLRSYILPLAALPALATTFGMYTFDRDWDPVQGYLVPHGEILAAAATTFFGIVVSIFLLAAIFSLIAPMFGCKRDYLASLKVATYGAAPVLVAGGTLVLPVMSIVALVGTCHTLFLYWVGVRRVLKVPASGGAEFVGISMVLLAFTSVIAGAAASAAGLV